MRTLLIFIIAAVGLAMIATAGNAVYNNISIGEDKIAGTEKDVLVNKGYDKFETTVLTQCSETEYCFNIIVNGKTSPTIKIPMYKIELFNDTIKTDKKEIVIQKNRRVLYDDKELASLKLDATVKYLKMIVSIDNNGRSSGGRTSGNPDSVVLGKGTTTSDAGGATAG